MSSRAYIKRVWRVPKDRGAPEYLATLMVKALVKHGWPAKFELIDEMHFKIRHHTLPDIPDDMLNAVDIVSRIVARTYRVDIFQLCGNVRFNRFYVIRHGHFKEVKE